MKKAKYMHLDPVKDNEQIVKWMVIDTWRFDLVRATEIALLKTFSIPEISKILVDSGEFLNRTQKRYDDTDLLLSLFIENGHSSPAGIEAIKRINRMHARHPITNDQMLYVLATFVVEPIVWIRSFGWRPLQAIEREALFHFWIAVGRRMGIRDLFGSLDEMLAYHESFERERMVYHPNNATLYHGIITAVSRMMPFPLGPFTRRALPAVMSPRLCASFRVKPAPPLVRAIVRTFLKTRGLVGAVIPLPPEYRTQLPRPTYPDGYTVKSLGV